MNTPQGLTQISSSNVLALKEYDLAKQVLEEGINYCEERNLDSRIIINVILKARMLLGNRRLGRSDSIVENLLANPNQPGIS